MEMEVLPTHLYMVLWMNTLCFCEQDVNIDKKSPQGPFKELQLPGKLAPSVVTSCCTTERNLKVRSVKSS